jgi:hypothetical protein
VRLAACFPRPNQPAKVSVAIGRDAKVSSASAAPGNAQVERCLRTALASLRFPPPEGGVVSFDVELRSK